MINAQNDKSVVVIKPQSVATNATATGRIDTIGFNYCSIDIVLDSAAATSSNPAVLNLSEGTITTFASATTVAAFVGDTGFTIPVADTESAQVVRFDVSLPTRERYLFVSSTSAGAAQIQSVTARLSRAEESPNTAAEAGAAARVIG